MTPKEKANELVQSFYNNQSSHSITPVAFNSAKRCALICVDEILKSQHNVWENTIEYWQEVEQEICTL